LGEKTGDLAQNHPPPHRGKTKNKGEGGGGGGGGGGSMLRARSDLRAMLRYIAASMVVVLVVLVIATTILASRDRAMVRQDREALCEHFKEFSLRIDNVFFRMSEHLEMLRLDAEYFFQYADLRLSQPEQDIYDSLQETSRGFHTVLSDEQKKTAGALTGGGSITNRDAIFYRELKLAVHLNGGFSRMFKAIEGLTWIHYFGDTRIINIYPWVPSEEFHFKELEREVYDVSGPEANEWYWMARPKENPDRRLKWAKAYYDGAGQGIMTTAFVPIYDGERFAGTIGADFLVDDLNYVMRSFLPKRMGTMVLVDQKGQVLAHPSKVSAAAKKIPTLGTLLPVELGPYENQILESKKDELMRFDQRLVLHAELNSTPFHLVYIEQVPSKMARLFSRIGTGVILGLMGLGVLVAVLIVRGGQYATTIKDRNKELVTYQDQLEELVEKEVASRQQAEAQLRQSQKMEAVGQMAGGMAHDFNNLLQIIGGYAELSQVGMDPESSVGTSIKQIDKAAQRGKTLISQLLAFSRRQVIDPVDLNMNEEIEPLLKMIRGLIGEHIKLDFIPGHGLGLVHADPGQIEQVLMNLCVNARDVMPEGGVLTIETENVLIDSEYAQTHSWATDGRCVLLRVSDTGCGMDKEILEHIFEPFFTTKEVGKGTGLGLSMVFGIIEQHNGHVEVYSEPDKGTIFKIYLPSVEHRATEVSSVVPKPVSGGMETLLVAEDDAAVLELTELALRMAGYTVLTAKNGEEALQVFEEHAEEIDMLIFDVVMPRLGGKEAMKRILKKHSDLPHLYVSGYSANAVHTNFIKNRGLHLLSKPYHTDELLRKIREVLDVK